MRWQGTRVTRERRWSALGHPGATLWFTGLPGAGKSTIAAAVEERLIAAGQPAFLLDGDNLRHGLNGDLGFDEAARRENVRRTAHVARLLAESGTIALVSLVSPYAPTARRPRRCTRPTSSSSSRSSSTRRSSCASSATRRASTRARAPASSSGLTGVGAPYEPPADPDLVLGTLDETVERGVERVLELLAAARPALPRALSTRTRSQPRALSTRTRSQPRR